MTKVSSVFKYLAEGPAGRYPSRQTTISPGSRALDPDVGSVMKRQTLYYCVELDGDANWGFEGRSGHDCSSRDACSDLESCRSIVNQFCLNCLPGAYYGVVIRTV